MNRSRVLYTLILAGLIFLSACKAKEEENKEDLAKVKGSSDPVQVDIQPLELGDFHKQLISNGKIMAIQKAELFAGNSARIKECHISNGQQVNKGELLLELDTEELLLEKAQANLSLDKAVIEMEDQMILAGYNSISDTSKLNPEKLNTFRNRSGYNQALQQIKTINYRLKQSKLYAPFSGLIANLELKQYDKANPAEAICLLIDNSTFEVEFSLLEMELPAIKMNAPVTVTPFAFNDLNMDATISHINPVVDKHGLVKVKARIKNSQNSQIFEGQNVKVSMEELIPDQLIIPKEALVIRSNQEVVFIHKDNLAKWKYVTILHENETQYAIKGRDEDLNSNMEVISSNNMNLAHDARVELIVNSE